MEAPFEPNGRFENMPEKEGIYFYKIRVIAPLGVEVKPPLICRADSKEEAFYKLNNEYFEKLNSAGFHLESPEKISEEEYNRLQESIKKAEDFETKTPEGEEGPKLLAESESKPGEVGVKLDQQQIASGEKPEDYE